MSLFQTSVVKKYLNDLSPELIDKKYKVFNEYFGNPQIQENIRSLKEEEFQEGFIRELFVTILDYTLKPNANFNIELEKKNIDDSKKADGAILKSNVVIAVIELKSTQTIDLTTVETQAFGYKNHNPKCQYIITSNFEKIRIYIQNAIDHIEFDLFKLTKEDFALLWLCFSKDNILNDVPLKIKEASVLQEENVTKKLYHDYSKFREDIFSNIVKTNPEFDKLVLFKKTQKLLDRFLFIFFAEDRLLLPPNSINEILKQWKTLKDELDEYIPLYDRFKKYFGYLNTGHKGKQHEIFAYNGGLFTPDEILDNIKIDDELLYKHTQQLSTYNYESEVDVNILGHIFEHSLGEIEHVQAEIAGEVIDTQKTKRKKDGIFYTPKYITKYIVENTVGKLCEEKRTELGVIDEEYAKGRKNRKKEIVIELDKKLTEYRNWLLGITILDPACGSGAFLNQALEFLIHEHKKIDELKAQLLGGSIVFSDIEAKILEKNIYGVDLNEESVDIAKLSLWLRTAQKGRKLTTLSNHIKCGNSLIDDTEVAGEKAFNWQNEFPEVFANGGFDVVIGNPPYVRVQNIDEKSVSYFNKIYKTAYKNYDLYVLFTEKIDSLINTNGIASYIMPKKFVTTDYGKLLKEYLVKKKFLKLFIDFDVLQVFSDATTYTGVFIFDKKDKDTFEYCKIIDTPINISNETTTKLSYSAIQSENWLLLSKKELGLFKKIESKGFKLIDISEKLFQGLVTGKDSIFILEKTKKGFYSKETDKNYEFIIDNNLIRPLLKGSEIGRYNNPISNNYIIYPYTLDNEKANLISLEAIKESDTNLYYYLLENEEVLRNREDGKFDNQNWYSYSRNQNIAQMPKPKILTQVLAKQSSLTIDSEGKYCFVGGGTAGGYGIILKDGYNLENILPILNSKLLQWFMQKYASPFSGGYYAYSKGTMSGFPIISDDNFFVKTQLVLNKVKEFELLVHQFNSLVIQKINISKLTIKLQNWYNIDFVEFLKELSKLKVKFLLSEEAEWLQYFNEKKETAETLKTQIKKLEREIDQIVYGLYGLTEEEIKIVEENT